MWPWCTSAAGSSGQRLGRSGAQVPQGVVLISTKLAELLEVTEGEQAQPFLAPRVT